MAKDRRRQLSEIKQFKQLIAFLRDEMGWPIDAESDFDDLTYEYTTAELGIDEKSAAQIQDIKRLRPLSPNQPWGVFFVKFEPKKLPVIALRRILSQVALKKRASSNPADRNVWAQEDLLFISNYGEGDDRQITLAHFSAPSEGHTLPTLKVLGWDSKDTVLHLEAVARELTEQLSWPSDESDVAAWRAQWSAAFTVGHQEVITTSKALSIRLAQLARDIRDRISSALAIETEDGPLTKLMKAFQEALIHDLTSEDFADMYAQTISYGLLSSRIADPTKKSVDDLAIHMRLSPFLKELMDTFLRAGGRDSRTGLDFDELGIGNVVNLLDRANMEAVVADFGDKNPQEDPVIHFYELFLKEYDAKKRMSRGVFYTPRPVVSYIVRSVDELLRTEFGLADGLADTTTWEEMGKRNQNIKIPAGVLPEQEFVQILDPATGTGTFLVEAVDLINKTLIAKWKKEGLSKTSISEMWNEYVPKHLLPRLHGYELLMAPYAIAHLKIGLKLFETGYRFESDERARIYLTNALEPAQDSSGKFTFALQALAHEASAVNEVKLHKDFTVIFGNPPYAGQSQNKGDWISQLVRDYYFINGASLGESNTKWLQDDYVKFFRLAQHLVFNSHAGVIGIITNHGYIDNPTFRGMRKSLLDTFSDIRVLDLQGNTKKLEGSSGRIPDENVFDIQQGVAIALCVAGGASHPLSHASLHGARESKSAALVANSALSTDWATVLPRSPMFLFRPQEEKLREEYEAYVPLDSAMPLHSLGIVTARDSLTIHWTRAEALQTVNDFAAMEPESAREHYSLGPDARDWTVKMAQEDLRASGINSDQLCQVLYRPFDWRWTYFTGHSRGFHCRPRGNVMRHMIAGQNVGLCTNRQVNGEFRHVGVTRTPIDNCVLSLATRERTNLHPLWVTPIQDTGLLPAEHRPNFSEHFLQALSLALNLPLTQPYGMPSGLTPDDVMHYMLAVLHSVAYRSRFEGFLRSGFPRIPLPGNSEFFRALAGIGSELATLQLLESPRLDQPITDFIGKRNPEVEKITWSRDTVWVDTLQATGFKGVPQVVWDFRIGGYQVCEKWLKDRKSRTLSDEDIAHYQKIVVALSETIRLMKEIDEVIELHGGWPGAFVGEKVAN